MENEDKKLDQEQRVSYLIEKYKKMNTFLYYLDYHPDGSGYDEYINDLWCRTALQEILDVTNGNIDQRLKEEIFDLDVAFKKLTVPCEPLIQNFQEEWWWFRRQPESLLGDAHMTTYDIKNKLDGIIDYNDKLKIISANEEYNILYPLINHGMSFLLGEYQYFLTSLSNGELNNKDEYIRRIIVRDHIGEIFDITQGRIEENISKQIDALDKQFKDITKECSDKPYYGEGALPEHWWWQYRDPKI